MMTTYVECECECGCAEQTDRHDISGALACEECGDAQYDSDGEFLHCDRGVTCPDCGEEPQFGPIQTQQYQSNWCYGTCGCDQRSWTDTERGNGFPGQITYTDTGMEGWDDA